MSGLKACPFCGGEAFVIPVLPERHGQNLLHRPQCSKCGCDLGGCDTEAEAIAAWNRRAAPSREDVADVLMQWMDNPHAALAAAGAVIALWEGGEG